MLAGCATMRRDAPSPDLRPCTDGYAYTEDGWRLGVRHYRPKHPDPGKLPVILCHGLGLNATFWTITDNHLPAQLAARGYEVYVFDIRGSGENAQRGPAAIGSTDSLRQTFLKERGERDWTVDDLVKYDVPAILDYVQRETGHDRVNWVGHSLGGMLVFPYLELAPHPERIANFVGMGSTIIQAETPQTDMLAANQGLRLLSLVRQPGRLGRPLAFVRIPGMELIDRFYYSNENVDRLTDLAVLRLHARGHRAGGLAAARPVSRVRPHALGRPHGRLLGHAGRDHHAHPLDRRRRRHHVGRRRRPS